MNRGNDVLGSLSPARAATAQQWVRARGFTLVELMIVVAIVAIIAAIAIPSYQRSVMRGNRNAAESLMLDMAAAQERFLVDNRNYATSASQLGYASSTYPNNVSANYSIAVSSSSGAPPSFTITATPQSGSQQANDTTCGTLTLTSAGTKQPTNQCWQ